MTNKFKVIEGKINVKLCEYTVCTTGYQDGNDSESWRIWERLQM